MNELQRQEYMKAMGVDYYVPRLTMPGAKVSTLCVMPELAIAPVNVNEPLQSSFTHEIAPTTDTAAVPDIAPFEKNSKANSAMKALFDENKKKSPEQHSSNVNVSENNKNTKTPHTPHTPQTSHTPHFSLTVVRGTGFLLVDDTVPNSNLTSDYLLLIQNLLFSLKISGESLSLNPFNWPMIKNSQVDQSERAARQTLEAFLSKQVTQLNIKYIIVMGKTAAYYMAGNTSVPGMFFEHNSIPVKMICTSSAVESLADYKLKENIWNDLQPLLKLQY